MGFQNAGLGGGMEFSKIDVYEILSYDKILWVGGRIGCSGASNFFVLSYDPCSQIFWDSKSKNLENLAYPPIPKNRDFRHIFDIL